jgi:hypothetical protein
MSYDLDRGDPNKSYIGICSAHALPAPQSAGEILHEGHLRILQRREIDIAGGLASSASNLQPGEAAVYGVVDVERWVDWLAVALHPLVPALAKEFVGLLRSNTRLPWGYACRM